MTHAKKADPRSVSTRYHINVTEDDIARAFKNNSAKCVVSTAIARAIPESQGILTDLQTIRFSRRPERKRLVYLTPPQVADYVVAFDAGEPVRPFSFTLSHPAFIQEMVVRREGAAVGTYPSKVTQFVETKDGVQEIEKGRTRHAPIRAKGRARSYGHRDLRINREK